MRLFSFLSKFRFSIYKTSIIVIAFLLLFLLFRNPYSGENIISDFLPLPDSLHYVVPARSLVSGHGLKLYYEGNSLNPTVPPLYSLYLAPFYLFLNDARSFYFANVLLSLFSVGLFYLIISKLKIHPVLQILSFFAFCTNIAIYWYPQVAMSENLFLFLFLVSVWLILKEINFKNIIFAGFIAIAIYATKYVEAIITGIFSLIYLSKIYLSAKAVTKNNLRTSILIFIFAALLPLILFEMSEYFNKETHIWPILFLSQLFDSKLSQLSLPLVESYRSSNNIETNFYQYLAGFFGGELTVAGQGLVMISPIIGMLGLVGLFTNPFISKSKTLSLYFLTSLMSVFIFCLFFYLVEGRYIIFAVPVLILSFAIFVDRLWVFFKKINRDYLIYLTAVILIALILLSQIPPVINELLGKNSLVKGDPNFMVINTVNNYIKDIKGNEKVAVISVIPPYLFDFYKKPNYKLIPASQRQLFMQTSKTTWGEDDYSDLINLYKKYLNSGYTIYLSGFKSESNFVYFYDFLKIRYSFNLKKVENGCEGKCDLYKVTLK